MKKKKEVNVSSLLIEYGDGIDVVEDNNISTSSVFPQLSKQVEAVEKSALIHSCTSDANISNVVQGMVRKEMKALEDKLVLQISSAIHVRLCIHT